MAIPTSVADLSTVDSTNSPQGSDPVGGNVDDYFRAHAGIIARQFKQGADIASAAALPIPIDGTFFNVTGAVGVTSIANAFNGKIIFLRFTSALTLTNSASLVLPGNVNYTTFVGEILQFVQFGASQWACISRKPSVAVDGSATMTAPLKVTDGTNTASYPADGNVAGSAVPQGNLVAMNTNLQNQVSAKVAKAGDTMTGALGLSYGASNATLPVDGNLSGTGVPYGSLSAMNTNLSNQIAGKQAAGNYVANVGVGGMNWNGSEVSWGTGAGGPWNRLFYDRNTRITQAFGVGSNYLSFTVDTTGVGINWFVSDARQKRDIKPSTLDAVAKISRIETYSFRFKEDSPVGNPDVSYDVGFIAQQLYKVDPAFTNGPESDDIAMSPDVLPILATAVKAIQELSARVKRLEAQQKSKSRHKQTT